MVISNNFEQQQLNFVVQRVTLDTVLAKYNFDFPFHPAVLKLGLKYADGSIKGANARCIAMLDMLREMVEDYTTPSGMHFTSAEATCFCLAICSLLFRGMRGRGMCFMCPWGQQTDCCSCQLS